MDGTSGKIEGLIHGLLQDIKDEIAQLELEIKEIHEENRNLAQRLMDLGWSQEEIQELIATTLSHLGHRTP